MMSQEKFLITSESRSIKLERDFVIEEINVIRYGDKENTNLFYEPSNFVTPVFTFVPEKIENIQIRALLKAERSHLFYTDNNAVVISGDYVENGEEGVKEEVLILRSVYCKTLVQDEFVVIQEEFDIVFFSARVECSECIERTSLIVEINGRDATLCTLSWGLCVNGLFRYKYKAGEELSLRVLGPGKVVLAGAVY